MHKVILRVLIHEVFNIDKILMITLRILLNPNITAITNALESHSKNFVIIVHVFPET